MKLFTAISLVVLIGSSHAQSTTYLGSSGCYGQQIAAIQHNSTLPRTGTVAVPGAATTYVRFLADTGRNVTGFDLMLATPAPQTMATFAMLYAANANDKPGRLLSIGRIGVEAGMRWCRACFDTPYRITANQLYFIAFDVVTSSASMGITTATNSLDVTYFTQPFGGSLSAAKSARIMYRVNADGSAPVASATLPTQNGVWTVSCTDVDQGRTAWLIFGLSSTQANGIPLPIDLAPDAPGSFLWISADVFPAAIVPGNANRQVSASFLVGANPGFLWYAQWLVVTNNGFAMSNALKLVVG